MDLAPMLSTLHIRTKRQQVISLTDLHFGQKRVVAEVEKSYQEDRPCRIICLKSRQIGISTILEAILFSLAVGFENTSACVLAHRSDSSNYLFGMTKFFYDSWEWKDQWPTQYSTRYELAFEDTGSRMWVATARTGSVGRGRTISACHASEVAMWKEPEESMVALRQAIPNTPGSLIAIESTPMGVGNLFEQMWVEAREGHNEYVPLFFPWFQHEESFICFGEGCTDGSCLRCQGAVRELGALDGREKELLKLGASQANLAFRRFAIPNLCRGSEEYFEQEYPADDQSCFLSSGVSAFPEPALRAVYEPMKPAVGRVVKNARGGVEFVQDGQGPLRVYKPPAKDSDWGEYFIGADACQPPGTLVRRVRGSRGSSGKRGPGVYEEVPIEEIRKGDRVVSFNPGQPGASIRRVGRLVTAAGSRDYSGPLVCVRTESGRVSRYTPEHRCVVRLDAPLADGNHVVYLAQRGDQYRIGRSTWQRRTRGHSGYRQRGLRQGADAMWILSVHACAEDAALDEAVLSVRHGIPLWQFDGENQAQVMPLGRFWDKIGGNQAQAESCLRECGLDVRYPFWERGTGWQSRRHNIVLRAVNLRPGMLLLEPDNIEATGPHGHLVVRRGCGGWSPVEVTREWYEGPVYSLDVDQDHTYIADGIATHNCYGAFGKQADYAAAQVINRRTHEQVAVWHGRMNPLNFADEMAKLGHFYNEAMIAPEVDGPGMALVGRLSAIYPRIWHHRHMDHVPEARTSHTVLGFSASWQRKAWAVSELVTRVERGTIILHDRPTMEEMRLYNYFGTDFGDVFAPSTRTAHDDLVMSLAICLVCESSESRPIPYDARPRRMQGEFWGEPIEPAEENAWLA